MALPRGQLHCFAGQTKYTCEAGDPRLLGPATKVTKAEPVKTADASRAALTLFTFPTCSNAEPRARHKPRLMSSRI